MPAEFGGKASALINVATKAGSNASTAACSSSTATTPSTRRTTSSRRARTCRRCGRISSAAALGGPLVQNRSFFFGSFEGQRMKRSLTRTFSVPTDAAVRAGNFSGFGTVCDPLTIPTTGVCTPFPNNRIPAGRIDPIAAAFLQNVPLPTSSAALQNLTSVEEQDRDLDQFSVRLDHQLTGNDQLFARFSTFDADELQPFGTSALQETLVPGFGRSLTTKTRNLVASHTHVFGSSLLNELRFGWMTRRRRAAQPESRQPTSPRRSACWASPRDPRDIGLPADLDRRAATTPWAIRRSSRRATTSTSSCSTTSRSIAARTASSSAPTTSTCSSGPSSPTTPAARSPTPASSRGNAFADFLLGYPTSAVSGIGRGDENGRTQLAAPVRAGRLAGARAT